MTEFIGTWRGQPIHELPREELLQIIKFLGERDREHWAERERMRPHVDWVAYLCAKEPA